MRTQLIGVNYTTNFCISALLYAICFIFSFLRLLLFVSFFFFIIWLSTFIIVCNKSYNISHLNFCITCSLQVFGTTFKNVDKNLNHFPTQRSIYKSICSLFRGLNFQICWRHHGSGTCLGSLALSVLYGPCFCTTALPQNTFAFEEVLTPGYVVCR